MTKIATIEEEHLHNFSKTWRISMKLSRKKLSWQILLLREIILLKITQNYLPCPINQQNKKIKGWKCLERTVCQIKQYVRYSWLLNVKNSMAQGLEVSIAYKFK